MEIGDLPPEVQWALASYSPEERADFLNGRALQRNTLLGKCDCSKCTFLKTYLHLKRGGEYKPTMLRDVDTDEHRQLILECLCLRSLDVD